MDTAMDVRIVGGFAEHDADQGGDVKIGKGRTKRRKLVVQAKVLPATRRRGGGRKPPIVSRSLTAASIASRARAAAAGLPAVRLPAPRRTGLHDAAPTVAHFAPRLPALPGALAQPRQADVTGAHSSSGTADG